MLSEGRRAREGEGEGARARARVRVREAGGLSGEDRGRYMERQKNKEGGVRKLLAKAPPLSPLQHRLRFKSPSAANQQLPGSVVTVHGGGVRERRNWVLPSTGSRGTLSHRTRA